MLSRIRLPFSQQDVPLLSTSEKNRICVVIGENGTRKSFLLRHVLNDAVNALKGGATKIPPCGNVFHYPPCRIIAISALPTDRFPSKYGYSEKNVGGDFEINEYTYIGPRTATNIVSRNQSARELISAILSAPNLVKVKRNHLLKICEQIGIAKDFSFIMRLVSPGRETGTSALGEINADILRVQNVLTRRTGEERDTTQVDYLKNEFLRLEVFRDAVDAYVRRLLASNKRGVERLMFPVSVDLAGGTISCEHLPSAVLSTGYKYGLLRPTSIVFGRTAIASEDALSTGQWSMFASLCTLALTVEHNSLVLIDEPENGLHPAWQRNYLRNILSAIDHVQGCQVIVATHSPLVLSALPLGQTDCIVLKQTQGDVVATSMPSPSGWDSNSLLEDVFSLESARGPQITELVSHALKLIGKGIEEHRSELQSLSGRLEAYRENLPEADVLRKVIATIIEVAFLKC